MNTTITNIAALGVVCIAFLAGGWCGEIVVGLTHSIFGGLAAWIIVTFGLLLAFVEVMRWFRR